MPGSSDSPLAIITSSIFYDLPNLQVPIYEELSFAEEHVE